MSEWKPDIVDWNVVDEPKARFLLEEAKAQLQATIDASKSIETKSFTLLGIVVLFLNGLNIYTVENWAMLGWIVVPVGIYILALIYSSVLLAGNIMPSRLNFNGNIPKNLLHNDKISQQLASLLAGEAMNYQNRIDENDKLNEDRARMLRRCVRIVVWTPLLLAFLSVLAKTTPWGRIG